MENLSYGGIDVSKDRLDVVVLPEGWFFSVSNDTAAWAELVARLRPLAVCAIGLEPSGGCKRGKLQATTNKKWVGGDYQPFDFVADKCCKRGFDRAGIARLNDIDLHPDGGRRRSQVSRNGLGIGMVGINQQSDARNGGTSSCSKPSCFAATSETKKCTPVALPPGRARLATSPSFTGSSVAPNTMGMVAVAAFAARAGGVESAMITAT